MQVSNKSTQRNNFGYKFQVCQTESQLHQRTDNLLTMGINEGLKVSEIKLVKTISLYVQDWIHAEYD